MANTITKMLQDFISNHPPKQVNRHLRTIFLEYIESQSDTGLPEDFQMILWEMNDLFTLLDKAEDLHELKKAKPAL